MNRKALYVLVGHLKCALGIVEAQPSWSPDGTRIAFVSGERCTDAFWSAAGRRSGSNLRIAYQLLGLQSVSPVAAVGPNLALRSSQP
jgi:Tol biopolymer transport system component